TAKKVESILREKGVVPATIAVLNGVCCVGLSDDELEDLAKAGEEDRAKKCSTRELPIVMAMQPQTNSGANNWGATTVASTMALAKLAGISTFVTGGIGGVHRNGHVSLDVSADLTELSRTPVVVVSAGIKSILDIGRTLEVLETLGVPAVTYGADEFPAFFTAKSGFKAPQRMDSSDDIARTYWASRALQLPHGMLVAVPNSDPAGDNVERAIHVALAKAEEQGVHGQGVTPFVLKEVAEQTGGDSLRSNMSLVYQNARVGADIAISIANNTPGDTTKLSSETQTNTAHARGDKDNVGNPSSADVCTAQSRVVVMGGSVIDLVAKPVSGTKLLHGTSNLGHCLEWDGGVARNVAEVLGLLGNKPVLYSAVGDDTRGHALIHRMKYDYGLVGADQSVRVVEGKHTATYAAVLDETGDLHTAIADMSVLSAITTPPQGALRGAEVFVMDANPGLNTCVAAAEMAAKEGVHVFFEPTSVPKARACADNKKFLECVSYTFPNMDELVAMTTGAGGTETYGDWRNNMQLDDFKAVKTAAARLLERMHPQSAHVVVTLGVHGVLLASRNRRITDTQPEAGSVEETSTTPVFAHFPAQEGVQVMNATGAGDSLCGAFIHALLEGKTVNQAVEFGMQAAVVSLGCNERAISPEIRWMGR
ncbi:hypothetical protein SARC_09027, partial [Sphaeroforma arctica JP610]